MKRDLKAKWVKLSHTVQKKQRDVQADTGTDLIYHRTLQEVEIMLFIKTTSLHSQYFSVVVVFFPYNIVKWTELLVKLIAITFG